MVVEASAARMALAGRFVSAAGGAEAFASRAISANVGTALLTDARMLGSGARMVPISIVGNGTKLAGSVTIDSANIARVHFGKSNSLKIVRTEARTGPAGKIAEHFDQNGQMVSYTRYSPDDLRFDYYAPVGDGSFQPVLYALRSRKTGDVTLFGPNHRYLGRAIYRMAVRRLAREAASRATDQIENIQVDLSDSSEYDDFRLCSEMYLLVRQTHFQQSWDTSTPLQFWDSMYADCPNDRAVILPYQETLLNAAVAETDRQTKMQKLDAIIKKFPDFEDAKLIRSKVVL